MVEAYWDVGRQIHEAQGKVPRAEYGKGLIKYLSEKLTEEFGKGYTEGSLRRMRQFYRTFPIRAAVRRELDTCHAVRDESDGSPKYATLSPQLSWTHYRQLIRIKDEARREFYLQECADGNWSTRQLERQINSFYFERLLATREEERESVRSEIQALEPKPAQDFILKDPLVLDFLDLKDRSSYRESELEQALIDKLQEFMLELGKGFAFVARQKRISSGGKHYYIDLVLYNFILKCFVLIDLKTGSLSHQDIGQIDFYRRIFDDLVKQEDDNATIGIVLCSDRDENIVRYSILADENSLLTSKYKLYLPTEEELQRELEQERRAIEQASLLTSN